MISSKEFAHGLFYGDRLNPASDDDIRMKVDFSATKIMDYLYSYRRRFPLLNLIGREYTMFSIGADRLAEFRLLGKNYSVDNDHVQEVAIAQMQKYGFHKMHFKTTTEPDRSGSGSNVEYAHFPSTTIKGLEFVRTQFLYNDTGKPYAVLWGVAAQR